MRLLVCSVVFPAVMPYFGDFYQSAVEQSNQDFDLLLVDDGAGLEGSLLGKAKIINARGSIFENRAQTIEYAIMHQYDYIAWQDSDDIMLSNRIDMIRKKITNEIQLLVHDLYLINEHGDVIEPEFIGSRIREGIIEFEQLMFYNFLGFGNTVARVECLKEIDISKQNIEAVDWWLFSNLLLAGKKAYYVNQAGAKYRQHGHNLTGVLTLNRESFQEKRKHILKHYAALKGNAMLTKEHMDAIEKYEEKLRKIDASKMEQISYNGKGTLWWEDIYNYANRMG